MEPYTASTVPNGDVKGPRRFKRGDQIVQHVRAIFTDFNGTNPWLVIAVWIAVIMYVGILEGGPRPDRPATEQQALAELDQVVRHYGTALPSALVLLRWAALGVDRETAALTLVFIILVTVVRICIYVFLLPLHWPFSDHVVLCWSMMAITLAELPRYRRVGRLEDPPLLPVCLMANWLLIFAIVVESAATARWYHTRWETCNAFLLGFLVFGGAAFSWRHCEAWALDRWRPGWRGGGDRQRRDAASAERAWTEPFIRPDAATP